MPSCVPSGLKPGFGGRPHPSLKAGVDDRQIVDDAVSPELGFSPDGKRRKAWHSEENWYSKKRGC